tara:strand:+ start:1494 stop:1871 length:378 start_codon:yes stop_codon:yes gene_type:complete
MMAITFEQMAQDLARSDRKFNSSLDRLAKRTANKMKNQAIKNAHIYPKRRTGTLIESIQADVDVESDGKHNIYIFPDLDVAHYAEYVEFGTSRMKPRLYIKRAIDKELPAFQKATEKLIQKAFAR